MTAVTASGQSGEIFDTWLAQDKWAVSTLTYSFPTDGSYYSYQPTNRVRELSEAQKDAVRMALGEISSFTALTFVEVTETTTEEATLRFADQRNLGGAYAYLPSTSEQGGDVFMGAGAQNPVIGNEAYLYFTHEIGHAMGLEHGHESTEFVASGYDSQEYTVVTYSDYSGDTDIDSYDSGPVDWAQSYQQLDIAALQFLYGANYSASGQVWSGDTVYTFDPGTGEMSINGIGQGIPAGNRIFRTIWDGNGDNDAYDLSNYATDLILDLRPGEWSTFSDVQLADLDQTSPDPARIARGNVANARLFQGDERSLIEHATGGSGDDMITGNQGRNTLDGLGGADMIYGQMSADTLLGGAGNDELRGQTGNDRLKGQTGSDKLFGGAGNDILIGGKGYDRMKGGDGNDTFRFRSVEDSLPEDKLDRVVDFQSGADVIDLENLVAGPLQMNIDGGFTGTGASAKTREKNDNTLVLVDIDGDGVADMKFFVLDTLDMTQGDFLL